MRKANYILSVVGGILTLLGVVMIIIGNNMNNDFYVRIEYYYSHGVLDSSGHQTITYGAIFLSVGAFMLLLSLYLSFLMRRKLNERLGGQADEKVDMVITKMAGSRTIFDVFKSEDQSRIYSFYRSNTCILKDGEKVYRGKMHPLKWENKRPTIWNITIDFGDRTEDFVVSKVDRNILVKGESGEEIFYRNGILPENSDEIGVNESST